MISVLKGVAEIVKQQHESVRRQLTMVQQTSEREVLAAGSQLAKIFEEMSDHTLRLATLKEDESSGTNEGSFAAVFVALSKENSGVALPREGTGKLTHQALEALAERAAGGTAP